MLEEHGIPFRYREYRKEPLSVQEIEELLKRLDRPVADLLRRRDKAYRELGLTGQESEEQLIGLMSEHPTLLQRPIAVLGDKAVVGRPVDALLTLSAG